MSSDRREQTTEVASSGSVPTVGQPARHRVLLVEDHAVLAEATAELLRFHGLEVRVAATGRDALAMAGEFNPVLVLCDIKLPDMTGLDVGQALRATRGANDLLIAVFSAMTAVDLCDVERQWKPRGIDLFLSKPLTDETLIDLISKLEVVGRSVRPDAAKTP